MIGRQEQITAKMEAVKLQQKESLKRREELISELELVNQLTQREAKEKEVERETTRRDLDAQVLQMTLIVILLLVQQLEQMLNHSYVLLFQVF